MRIRPKQTKLRKRQLSRQRPLRSRRLFGESLEDRRMLATVTWDGGSAETGTDWLVAENWVGDQLPGEGDDVVIPATFSGTSISSSGPVNVRSVDSHANHNFFQLEINAASQFFGNFSGDVSGNGLLWLGAENDLGVSSNSVDLVLGEESITRLRSNFAYVNPISIEGELLVEQNLNFATNVHVRPGGQIRLAGDHNLLSLASLGSIHNEGTIIKSGGDGTATIFLPITHQGQGTLQVNTGTLELSGIQTGQVHFELTAGVVNLSEPGNSVATHTLSATNSGAGTLRVSSSLELEPTSSLDLQRLELHGGNVETESLLQVAQLKTSNRSHLLATRGSSISGNGSFQVETLQIQGTTELGVDSVVSGAGTIDAATLTNTANLVNREGRLTMSNGATIANQGTWSLEAGADVRATDVSNQSSGSRIQNSGSLRQIYSGSTPLEAFLSNTGLVEVTTGTLRLTGGGANSGSIAVAEEAVLQTHSYLQDWEFPEGQSLLVDGSLETYGDTRISGSGEIRLETANLKGGELSFRTATPSPNFAVLQAEVANLLISGGALAGWGEVTVTDQLFAHAGHMRGSPVSVDGEDYRGKTILAAGANALFINSVHITERDLVTFGSTAIEAGQVVLANESRWENHGSASLFQSHISSTSSAIGVIANIGTFTSVGDSVGSRIDANFQNAGNLQVTSSELQLFGPSINFGSIYVAAAASLKLMSGSHQWGVEFDQSLDINGRLINRASTTISASSVSWSLGVGAIEIEQLELEAGTLAFTYEAPDISGAFKPLEVSIPRVFATGGTLGGYGQVTVTEELDVESMTMRGDSVQVGGLTYRGKTILAEGATAELSKQVILNDRDVELLGPTSLRNLTGFASLVLQDTARLENHSDFELFQAEIRGSSTNPGTFANYDNFVSTGGEGKNQIFAPFHNYASLQVHSPWLEFYGGGSNEGSVRVTTSSALSLRQGTFGWEFPAEESLLVEGRLLNFATTHLSGLGQFRIGQLELAAGKFSLWAADPAPASFTVLALEIPELSLTGGTLGGYGQVTVTENLLASSGAIHGDATTVNDSPYRGELIVGSAANALFQDVALSDRDITLLGLTRWSGQIRFDDGTRVTNEGDLSIDAPQLLSSSLTSNPSRLTNHGSITFLGDTRKQLSFELQNSGRIEVQAGELVTWGPGTTTGDFLVGAGAELELAGNGQNGSGKFTINQSSPENKFGGQGAIVASGIVSLDGVGQFEAEKLTIHHQFTLHRDLELPRVQLGPNGFSAMLKGDHNLIITEEFDWQGSRIEGQAGIVIGADAVATLRQGAAYISTAPLHNYGHLELIGNLVFQSDVDLVNYQSATLELNSGTIDHPSSSPPRLVNHGLVEHTGVSAKTVRARLWNLGTLRVNNNRLQFNSGAENVRNFDGKLHLMDGRWEILQSGNEQAGIFLFGNTNPINVLDAELILSGAPSLTFFRNQQNVDLLNGLGEVAKSGRLEFHDGYQFTIPPRDVELKGTLELYAGSQLTVQGNLTQHSTTWLRTALGAAPGSELNARLEVQGSAQRDGVFEVLFVDGYGPSEGDTFIPYVYASGQGSFAETRVPLLGQQASLSVEERAQDILVTSLVSASDLQAIGSSINLPSEANGGTEITVEYTVENLTATAATGSWIDSIYLSLDDQLDPADILLGRHSHSGGVAGDSSYTETAQIKLPALNEEQYRILVYPDSRGLVPDANRSNNLATSVQTLDLKIAELPYNSPETFQLAREQEVFYRLEVPWGAEIVVDAQLTGQHQAEIYARRGEVPKTYQSDVRAQSWNAELSRLTLKDGGTWYLMVRGKDTAIASEEITLLANAPQIEIRQLSPHFAHNLGSVTFTIEGQLLRANSRVAMVDESNGTSIEADLVTAIDGSTLAATFDLSGAIPGVHRIQVSNADGSQASETLNILEGSEPGRLEFLAETNVEIRPRGDGYALIVVKNVGQTDVPFSPIFLRESGDKTVVGKREGLNTDPNWFEDLIDYTLLDSSAYVNGVIPPRATVLYELDFKTNQQQASPPLLEFEVKTPIDPSADLDWDEIQIRSRPYYIDIHGWDVVFHNLKDRVGDSQADLQTAMSEELAYLTSIGTSPESLDADAVINFMLRQANDGFVSHSLVTQRDFSSNAATLPLHFSRSFQRSIVDRFAEGSFGRGWTHSYDYRVLINYQDEGLIRISTPEGIRTFERRDFATQNEEFWFQEVGGAAVVYGDSSLVLQEADGTSYLMQRFIDSTASWNYRLKRVFDELGNNITAEYDDQDRLIELNHSNGDSLTFEYIADRVRRITDHAGRQTEYTYDAGSQHLISAINAAQSNNYQYEQEEGSRSQHALTHVTAKDGSRLIFTYDENGRLASSDTHGDEADIAFAYSHGSITSSSADGTSVTVHYNHLGQAAQVDRENGETIQATFNEDHYLSRLTLPGEHSFDFEFSRLGLVDRIQSPDGSTISQNIIGQRTLRGQIGPFDIAFTMFREPAYELTQLGDALERKSVYDYDDDSRLTTITYPDASQEHFGSYNALGQPTEYVNRRGQSQVYEFSPRGEILSRTVEEGTESFLYDSRGRLVQAHNQFLTSAFSYDDADRLLSVSHSNGLALYYGYDTVGKLVSLLDQDGQGTRYSYDANGRLSELKDESSELLVAYFYDASNRLARKEQGNGTATAYTYHELGQIETIRHLDASGNAQNEIRYEYDALGLRTSATDKNGNWEYTYDRLGQLILASFASRVPEIDDYEMAYEYDRAGNRVKTTKQGITASYGVNSRNQYTQIGEDLLSYDADGNLLKRDFGQQTTLYTYDSQNRLMRVSRGNDVWDYEYDALGNRVASIYNGQRTNYLLETTGLADVLGEYNAAGLAVTRYSHGIGLESQENASGSAAYYQFDALGSTTAITDSSGEVVNSYFYDPFGSSIATPVESVENPFQYVGQSGVMQEQHGLQFMRARYYSPDLGRFVAEDPRRHDGGINLYRYVGNQPTLFVDPQGTYGYPGAPPFTSLSIVAELTAGEAAAGAAAEAAWLTPSAVTVTETAVVASEAATVAEGALVATEGSAITSTAGRALGGFILPELMVGITGVTLAGVAGFALGSAIVDAMPDVGSFWGDLAWDTWETLSESATRIVASWDPNDISGPLGVTEEHFQDSDRPLPYPYRIRFENLEEATAPAYQVVITQQLDESLDWSTFELLDFGFGNLHFEIPRGLSNYATRIDLRPELDLLLDLKAGVDSSSGKVSWSLTSLSPDTLDIPIDPQLGFLPPNVESPQGQGYVNYRIHPKPGLDDGQRITAQASIVFDTNEAIETNVYSNAIDRELPVSHVIALPAEIYQEDFTVSWSGEDFDGSGVSSWDIYVSTDEGPYQLWLDDTQNQQAIFTGELGKQYRFISAASDYVGHVEKLPEQHDATTYLDPLPWQNSIASNDVDPNGFVTPLDALIVINDLNLNGARALPTPQSQPTTFLDPSGDNFVTPLDALLVIDHLNSVSGEGESSDANLRLIDMTFGMSWLDELDDRKKKLVEELSPEILDQLLAKEF